MVQQGIHQGVDDCRSPGENGGDQVEDGEGQHVLEHVAQHGRQEGDEEDDEDGQHSLSQLQIFSQVHAHHCQTSWI